MKDDAPCRFCPVPGSVSVTRLCTVYFQIVKGCSHFAQRCNLDKNNLLLQDAGKQMQDMQLDSAGMKRRLVELHSNETVMVSEAVQLRTELSRTQGELTRQIELTREAQASEAAMKARLSAEEKNNAALKAALDLQTQVSLCSLAPSIELVTAQHAVGTQNSNLVSTTADDNQLL